MNSVRATVESVNGDKVVLRLEDGQTVTVPVVACEGTPAVGGVVRLFVVAPGSEDAGRRDLARELLNEILGPTT